MATANAATRHRHCSDALPVALDRLIKHQYPDWHLLSKKEYRLGCPGIAKVDFYGDGRPAYAIAIEKYSGIGGQAEGKLILAHRTSGGWQTSVLEEPVSGTGLVWHEPPGKYEDRYKERTLIAKGDVVLYFGPGSWTIAYGWTGERVDKVWLTD
jgi:hypothetical protein